MTDQQVRDGSGDRRYFFVMPNMADDCGLDVYEFRLLAHYKRVCGEKREGSCWEAVRTTALACGMSVGKVVESRLSLAKKKWIKIEEHGTGRTHTATITIRDRWTENLTHCQKRSRDERSGGERSPGGGNVHESPDKRSRGDNKEEHLRRPIKKNIPLSSREGSPKKKTKAITPEFLTEMERAFPQLDVQREYEKFCDYNRTKGRRLKDYRAGLRLWLRKAEEFAQERASRGTGSPLRAVPRVRGGMDPAGIEEAKRA